MFLWFRYSGSSIAIHYFCILILAATLDISDVCLSGPNLSVSNSFWKWIMSPKLLRSHLWVNLSLLLLSIGGHSEYLAASVISTSALSTCYLSRYLPDKDKSIIHKSGKPKNLNYKVKYGSVHSETELAKHLGFRSIFETPFVSLSLHFQWWKFMTYQSTKY